MELMNRLILGCNFLNYLLLSEKNPGGSLENCNAIIMKHQIYYNESSTKTLEMAEKSIPLGHLETIHSV